jgi:hypothetical protein
MNKEASKNGATIQVKNRVVNKKWKEIKEKRLKIEEMETIEANQGRHSIESYDWLQWEVFQPANKDHQNLVFGIWCRHIKSFPEYGRMIKPEFMNQRKLIGDVVARCPPILLKSRNGEPYFGFICSEIQEADYGEAQVLHFLYIREAWRQRGLANLLMKISFPYKWKKDTIFFSYPMRAASHLAGKWLLQRKKNAIFYEVKDGK